VLEAETPFNVPRTWDFCSAVSSFPCVPEDVEVAS
jgi:hypothetical protein